MNTNLKEANEKRLPQPHTVGGDPSRPEWESLLEGETIRVSSQMGVRPFQEHDLFLQFNKSGGGLGDPIDRDPKAVEHDLLGGDTSELTARNVYCVAFDPETKKIDPQGTETLRADMRKARLERGRPAAEYIEDVREKILKGGLPRMPKECVNQILERSEGFREDFLDCWRLPPDFDRIP